MDNNEKWEKLISMPEEYEQDNRLAQKAIADVANQPVPKKEGWFLRNWKRLTACVVPIVLVLGIGIPVYVALNKPQPLPDTDTPSDEPPIIYYDNTDLTFEAVTDVANFVQENNLPIGYFNPAMTSQYGYIEKTGEIACLYQNLIYFGEEDFDEIQLKVIMLPNVELRFEENYLDCTDSMNVQNISVAYKVEEKDSGENQVYVRFMHDSAEYYLEIVTYNEVDVCIQTYVNMLVG